ncbi:Vascular endothelial growth factor receptor 1 [Holothuria leucospilota]|uniref:receptor protein-tyrosine kinase n=1 Tax=Holothuria leucospilota TaxID=206669 RepID=A0A9Q0YPG4_HOLLE|nr:Vascular endothelial growth factor receptor 1 [Holothuria leucospilota]
MPLFLLAYVEKPSLEHADTNLILTEGSRLALTCSGLFPLEWAYPTIDENGSPVIITSQLSPPVNGSLLSSTWRETSVLTLENLTIHDSGEYRCSHRGTDIFSEEKWSATRVFVIKDANQSFLPHRDEPITVFPGQPFIIPCRSFPNKSVTLRPDRVFYSNKEERRDRRSYLDNLPYSHHIGFQVDGYQLWFGERMRCFIRYGSEEVNEYFNLTVVDSPSINVGAEVVLAERESLQLSCAGSLRILWSFPIVEGATLPQLKSRVDGNSGLFTSELIVDTALSSNSGSYSCFYANFRTQLSPELQTSTYVFVASENKDEDFLPIPKGGDTLQIFERSFVIPCRVNNPKTEVDLQLCYRDRNSRGSCRDSLRGDYNITYQPQAGFYLSPKPTAKETRFNLLAHCSTARDSQVFHVFFEGGENSGLAVNVTASATKIFADTPELNITCRVDILTFLLQDVTFRPQLVWEFSGKENASKRIVLDEDATTSLETFSYYSHLTVFNVTSNSGNITFTCHASNSVFSSEKSINVVIFEDAFINIYNLDPQNRTSFELLEGYEGLCIRIRIEAFPAVSVTWFHNDMEFFPDHDDTIVDSGDDYVRNCSVCFGSIKASMRGRYSITVVSKLLEANKTFELEVLVPPSIEIEFYDDNFEIPYEGASPLYYAHDIYTISCEASGYPEPMVHWEYSECKSVGTDNEKCIADGRKTQRFSMKGGLEYVNSDGEASLGHSELELEAQVSAIFKCVATSPPFVNQSAEAFVRFLVLTEKEAFAFIIQRGIYVNQTVRMDCIVNRFSFKEAMIGTMANDSGTIIPLDSKLDNRIIQITTLQDNSRKRTVRIQRVKLEDAGIYYCKATPEVTDVVPYKIKQVELVVREIMAVKVHCDNNVIIHDVTLGNLQLNCTITGDPLPTARWDFPEQPSLNTRGVDSYINYTTFSTTVTVPASYLVIGSSKEVILQGTNFGSRGITVLQINGVASPTFELPSESYESEEGKNFTLKCSSDGFPVPTIEWRNEVNRIDPLRTTVIDGTFTLIDAKVADSGIYICTAWNEYGKDELRFNVTISPVDEKTNTFSPYFVIFICLSTAICFLIALIYFSQKKNSKDRQLQMTLNELNRGGMYPIAVQGMLAEEIYERLPYDPRWEFTRERLILGPVIGRGAFGMVIKAKAVGIESPNRSSIVAVKTLKDEASETEKKALWAELKLLAHVGRHLNVVNFLGACTTGSPLLLIVEFCTYGNLSDYLRKRRRMFYGSRDNTGSDSSQMSTSTSFPNLSNESTLQPVRECHTESNGNCNQTSTGGTCDSAIGNSPNDSPFFVKPKGAQNRIGSSVNPHSIGIKSRSSIDLSNTGSLHRNKKTEKSSSSNDSGQGQKESKRSGLSTASSMGSLNRNAINQIRYAISPAHHAPLHFEDSGQSAFELPLREEDLICYAFQTARGMDFLSSKQVIHRDLAARNVLLTDSNVVKICDFGLARHLYHNPDYIASGKGRFPVKWMAPESIFDKIYTTQTDIWSFGVLLWEIFSLGGSPYPGLQIDENFYSKLKEGYRMSPPEIAPPEIGDIMHQCWNENPKERPPFSDLEIQLGDLLAANTRLEYIEMNSPYEDMTAELEAQQQEHLKETSLLLPSVSQESLGSPVSPSETESATENSNEPPSLSDFHQTTIV